MPLLQLDDGQTTGTAGPPELPTRLLVLVGETRLVPLAPARLTEATSRTRLTPLGMDARLEAA